MSCKEKLEAVMQGIGTLFQIIGGVYLVFCMVLWFYYIITLHQVPNDCSFFSLSANVGFIMLVIILMCAMICT